MRIAMGVEYDGTPFSGWQRQRQASTVQARLEQALSQVAARPVAVVCAGRTDAGVHARGQVIHFDTQARRPPRAWVLGANVQLPAAISVHWARVVEDTFHARFSATARRYRYVILNRWVRSALDHARAAWEHRPLDADRMACAGRALLGKHDFSAFRAAGCQARTSVREVHELAVRRQGDFIVIEIEANAFLQHMVRNIAGTLMRVGRGEADDRWVAQVLATGDRRLAGVTAPPEGLYFLGVRYPNVFALPDEMPPVAVR